MSLIKIQKADHLGQAVRATRKHLGLTQSELALASQVGVRFIVDLESGKPTVRLESVMQVISALGGELQIDGMFTDEPSDAHKKDNRDGPGNSDVGDK